MKDSKKIEILKFSGLTTLAGIISRIFSVPHSIIFAKFLMPSGFGLLQIINVVISYFAYAQLGILQAMNRNVPKEYANNDIRKVQKIKDQAFTWLSFATFFALFILWFIYLFNEDFNSQLSFSNILLITSIIIFRQINSFIKPLLKAEGEFIKLGKVLVVKNSVSPIIGMILVYFYNISGALYALVIDQLIVLISSLILYSKYVPRVYFNFNLFLEQISTGFLIFLNRFSETLISSLTILLIGLYYSTEEVGIFSFGLVSLISVQKYSVPLRIYLYREIMIIKDSSNKNHNYYKKLFNLPHIFNLLLNSVLLALFSIVYFTIINLFLPKFEDSIQIIYISVFSLIIYNARAFFGQFLDATNQLVIRTIYIFIGAGTGILLSLFFLINKMPLFYMSISCGLGFLLISFFMIVHAHTQVYSSYLKTCLMIIKILFVAIFNTSFVYFCSYYNFLDVLILQISFTTVLFVICDLIIKALIVLFSNYIIFGLLFSKNNFFIEFNKIVCFFINKLITKQN